MTKQVELTWLDGDKTVVETCDLIEEDEDQIFCLDTAISLGNVKHVLFEDEEGIFGLLPEQILHIRTL